MTEPGEGRLGRRLRRILLLLPYAIRHPGVTVDELSRKFGVHKRDLIADLNLVFMCGLPGYGPGDLIDVTVEDDRIYVRMADYFSTPLRLTPAEALTLYSGGAALANLPGMSGAASAGPQNESGADALSRALKKLGRAIGIDDSGGIRVQVEAGPTGHVDQINDALARHKKVRLEYFSASRGELTSRVVQPWGLIAALGRGYLVGFDELSADERMFRVDRIKSVAVLDEPADVPADFDPDRYRGAWLEHEGQDAISLEISPSASQWFQEYYPVRSSRRVADGWTAVELSSGGTTWAATLVLKMGADVRSVQPAEVLETARALASRILAIHD